MTRTLLLAGLTVFVMSCSDDIVGVPTEIPTIEALCTSSDVPYCTNSTTEGSTSVGGNWGVVTFSSGEGMVAGQVGQLSCGDAGGSKGKYCSFTTTADDWVDAQGEPVTEILTGAYLLQFHIDANGTVSDPADDFNEFFNVGIDIVCTIENAIVTNIESSSPIGGEAFKCSMLGY